MFPDWKAFMNKARTFRATHPRPVLVKKKDPIPMQNVTRLRNRGKAINPGSPVIANPGSTKSISSRELEDKAFELRKDSKSYREIGAELGVSPAGAYQAVMRVLDRMEAELKEPAKKVRAMELAKLDQLEAVVKSKAKTGDLFAADRLLKIMERRARLTGIDMPTKVQHSGDEENPVVVKIEDSELDKELHAVAVLLGFRSLANSPAQKTILGTLAGEEASAGDSSSQEGA